MQCKKCGLHFRYSDSAESPKKRSTAAVLARVGGIFGLHHIYLGYIALGAVRIVLFASLMGLFVCPQLAHIFQTGMFRVEFDFVGIAGTIAVILNIISYILAVIESVRISEGIVTTDSAGLYLR